MSLDLGRLRSSLGYRLFLLRRRHSHWVVQRRDGAAGFGMIGQPRASAHFARYYLDDREARPVRRGVHGFDFTRRAHRLAEEFGLAVVCRVDPPRKLASDLLALPSLIGLSLALPDSPEAYVRGLSTSAQSDLAKVRGRGFQREISRDLDLVAEFQRRFHEPSMRSRHGDDGYIFSAEHLRNSVEHEGAELIRVMRGGEWVAGLVARPEPAAYHMLRVGWRDGSADLLKSGALAAIYWFSVQRAYECGLRRVLTGAAAPYLEDGLFSYKSKWGAVLDWSESKYEPWHVLLNPAHPHCRKFLNEHSIIFGNAGRRFTVLSGRLPGEVRGIDFHRGQISAWYRLRSAPEAAAPAPDPASGLPSGLARWFEPA